MPVPILSSLAYKIPLDLNYTQDNDKMKITVVQIWKGRGKEGRGKAK